MAILQSIIDAAPIYQSVSAFDSAIWISNADGIIVHCQAAKTFDMTIGLGEKIKENGSMDQCLKNGKEISMVIPKEMYGNSVKAIAKPIFENNKLVGAIAVGTSLATQETLHEAAETIASTSQQISATSQEVAATATQLSIDLDSLRTISNNVLSDIVKTDEILKFVSDIAASSNILGLNAAIEAARAGEQGRGFAVVAKEIRKMADDSTTAVKDIKSILQTIRSEAGDMTNTILSTAQLGERQAAASEEISASMQQFTAAAMDVQRISQIV
ncbi:methyl-accepting chemotaxis protein [Pelosinus sp. sgz500959]|uniref:methyl-accepting chemotaxis protein n=1 Tax=Pelosinus sp. sgz500959 TaxID=3242472 RepID=UPI00366F4CB2